MIKKAGLTIAVAAAGMLAISPLAFAGDDDGGHDGWGGHSSHGGWVGWVGHGGQGPTQVQNGLVNAQDVVDSNVNAAKCKVTEK